MATRDAEAALHAANEALREQLAAALRRIAELEAQWESSASQSQHSESAQQAGTQTRLRQRRSSSHVPQSSQHVPSSTAGSGLGSLQEPKPEPDSSALTAASRTR